MLKRVRIHLVADQTGEVGTPEEKTEHLDMFFEGRCRIAGDRFSLTYRESELTGMEGTITSLSFLRSDPTLITLLRTGTCRTALIFEEGRRHISLYETPVMTLEVCVHTHLLINSLYDQNGELTLKYSVELRGAATERTAIHLSILPAYTEPLS